MLITRKSLISGKTQSMEIPVTQAELDHYYSTGGYIQDCLPHLTPQQREFIKTGITPEEWDQLDCEDDRSDLEEGDDVHPKHARDMDALFWVGGNSAAVLVNYTTGRNYALITELDEAYDIRLCLGCLGRVLIWWSIRSDSRFVKASPTLGWMEIQFANMAEAIAKIDKTLERLRIIPERVNAAERYAFLEPLKNLEG